QCPERRLDVGPDLGLIAAESGSSYSQLYGAVEPLRQQLLHGELLIDDDRQAVVAPLVSARYIRGRLRTNLRSTRPIIQCGRGELNPHALRHWILSPARLPFRHARV